jgi:hypothetical protein
MILTLKNPDSVIEGIGIGDINIKLDNEKNSFIFKNRNYGLSVGDI